MRSRPSRENYAEAIGLFERALALDPRSVEAQSWLANALAGRVLDRMTDSAAADIERAEALVGRALAASPRNPLAHFAKGQVLRAQTRYEEAIPEYETAIAFDRNSVSAYAWLGRCKVLDRVDGRGDPARGTSNPPQPARSHSAIGTGESVPCICCNRAPTRRSSGLRRRAAPIAGYHRIHASLAAAYALKGETERAAAELAEARRLSGDDRYSSIARLKARRRQFLGAPKIRALFEATYFAGLRKAGMPEENASEPAGGLSWSRAARVKLVLSEGWLQLIDRFFAGATV